MESFLGDPKANLISIFLDSYDPKKKASNKAHDQHEQSPTFHVKYTTI
jgi:hypothetical protein